MRPHLVVLHYTAMESAEAALERLCDPAYEVSSHYLIGADGQLWQLVAEEMRAWHAGAGEWAGQGDINSRSIGIELDNRGDHPFSEPQVACLERLLPEIMARWGIRPEGLIGHSDMAPGRKQDPGPRFDWQRLAKRGLARPAGVARAATAVTPQTFREAANRCGFTAETDDATLLATVRLRYRPWARGPLCAADLAVLAD